MSTLPVPPPVIRGVRRVGMRVCESLHRRATWDAVVVGGGHNGLVAAAYLARAGPSVLVLERAGHVGRRGRLRRAVPGVDARLSRYSYLVSLLPRQIVDDLGLDVRLRAPHVSPRTPRTPPTRRAACWSTAATRRTRAVVRPDRRRSGEHAGWQRCTPAPARRRRAVFPTLTEPLPTRDELREQVGDDAAWAALFEGPIGETSTRAVRDDLVRGSSLTDAPDRHLRRRPRPVAAARTAASSTT